MTEEWRPVVGFEGRYEVSDAGRVASLPRPWVPRRTILKPVLANDGRYLSVKCDRSTLLIHAIVCVAFHGPRPDGMQVRHLNGNGHDNAAANLAWGTSSENAFDRVDHGTHYWAARTHCKNGHEFAGENVRMQGRKRVCRACERASGATYRARRKEHA